MPHPAGILYMNSIPVYLYEGKGFDYMPKTVTHIRVDDMVKEIPKFTFVNYINLVALKLPMGLTVIEDMAFWSCKSLKKVRIPPSVILIGRKAFADCASLTIVDLPKGLKHLGESAFSNCVSLKTATLPSTLTEIRKRSFENCTRLQVLELVDGLHIIGDMACNGCVSLLLVRIPSTVKQIGQYAFAGNSRLLSVELPKSLRVIGYSAFSQCDLLRNISLPSSKNTNFGSFIFGGFARVQKRFQGHPNLWDALKTRFEGLPLHKICYSQSYYSTVKALEQLNAVIERSDAAATDCFGLTPFHILALSTRLNMHVWISMLQRFQVQLVHEPDQWGCSALYYLCVNHTHNSTELVRYVVQSSITNRLGSFGLGRWKIDLLNDIENLSENDGILKRIKRIENIYCKLMWYTRLEKLSLLELALWKMNLDTLSFDVRFEPKVRESCRIKSGVHIVMTNISPFMGEFFEEDAIMW
jgi:hypothetical protein